MDTAANCSRKTRCESATVGKNDEDKADSAEVLSADEEELFVKLILGASNPPTGKIAHLVVNFSCTVPTYEPFRVVLSRDSSYD